MNTTIVQCGPWSRIDNNDWSLVEVNRGKVLLPEFASLSQNHPNPFNSSTVIEYVLPKAGYVSLKIYNICGQQIQTLVNSHQKGGVYSFVWRPQGVSSGVYFCRLTVAGRTQIKPLTLLK